jgi:RNA polymerase sigma factor (sigma-70 family)
VARRRNCRSSPGGAAVGQQDAGREAAEAALARVYREEAGRLTGSLVRILGNFDVAEEAVQDAILAAMERWPVDGIPAQPGAWLQTVARRRAIDRLRRDANYQSKLAQLREPERSAPPEPDDRLRLIFTCCHPALSREAQVALTLRTVVGLTTPQIARAFLTTEPTVAQRIVRAKRKIVDAGIPYRIPEPESMGERLREVLAVLYLMFNEGYLSSSGDEPHRRDLAEDAAWLAGLMVRLMPEEAECWGLLALMRLHIARADARFDPDGRLVRLQDQDRSRWNRRQVAEAVGMLERAGRLGRPGPYQLQAAIAAVHTEARTWEQTDWRQVLLLYHALVQMIDSPVVRLNRAVARRYVDGPEAALAELETLSRALDGYHLYHATHAELLEAAGRGEEAGAARRRALDLTENPAERELLQRQLA